jgi:hypothetical protein
MRAISCHLVVRYEGYKNEPRNNTNRHESLAAMIDVCCAFLLGLGVTCFVVTKNQAVIP